jgi:hypothetical protein
MSPTMRKLILSFAQQTRADWDWGLHASVGTSDASLERERIAKTWVRAGRPHDRLPHAGMDHP